MKINVKDIENASFRKYGRRLSNEYDVTDLLKKMDSISLPDSVTYIPSVGELEDLPITEKLQMGVYGDLPIQIGYCIGHNHVLNALEYHKSPEVNIALYDMILLLGMQQDIKEDNTYDTGQIEAFLIPAGIAVELYATTLHYIPCDTSDKGFKSVVILLKGTNQKLVEKDNGLQDASLFARNKWLIAHKDANIEGALEGLIGDNIRLD